MKTIIALLWLTIVWVSPIHTVVYEALKGDSIESIEQALEILEAKKLTASHKAYKGSLLMKKAGFLKVAARKIETFKKGHHLLETQIQNNPDNVEFRFLRLSIQEHAPKILKYNQNLEEDKDFILTNYKRLQTELKTHIREYASQSAILETMELKD